MTGKPPESSEVRGGPEKSSSRAEAAWLNESNGWGQPANAFDLEVTRRLDSEESIVVDAARTNGVPHAVETSMRSSLDALVRLFERLVPGMRGSVLLLDEDGVTLRHGSAPNLPDAYCRLIDGERIGPVAGSCGTAAYRRERVIVRDIATDPLWANYRQLAESFGLAACWSTPILDREGNVLGTFAMYYGDPREPTPADIELTETATLLAGNIITRARAEAGLYARTASAEGLAAALRRSQARYQQLADSVPDQVWTASPDGRLDYVNRRALDYFGRGFDEMLREGWQGVVHPDDLPSAAREWTRSLSSGASYQVEFRLRRVDGEYRCHIGRAVPMCDADGRIVRWFGTNTDIDDQRRAEAALRASEEQLRASEGRLRAALQASSTSTWRWDMRTNVVDSDEGLFQLFGVDPATATGSFDLFVSRIHPEDRDRVIAAALRCASEGVELDEEFRIVRPDGSIRWAVDKGSVIRDESGKPQYLIGACVDVTDRRVHDEQLRALAESIPQLAWIADATGARDWFNQRWYDYTGATPDEARGWGWLKFHHPDFVSSVADGIRRSWETGEQWEDTFLLRGKDDRYRWFLSRARPIRDADGQIVRWFGTSTDINELREAELARDRALAEAKTERARLYEVFMQAPAGITVLQGAEHVFTVANERYYQLIGRHDIIGKPVREAMPELADQGFFELLDTVYESGTPHSERERVVTLDRNGDGQLEDLYVNFVYQPLKDAGRKTFGILVHAVDVTEQVHSRQVIAAARAEAERANKAKSEFLAAMSHDLRTPINAMGGFSDLVADGVYGPVNEEQRKAMMRIRRAGNHLLSLINDILGFAKIEAGRIQLQVADVSVSETVAGARAMVETQAAKKGISLDASAGPDGVHVRADRERMTQILTNLLTNALKFTDSGSITVTWRADDRAVYVSVTDTGRGIPTEKLASIFEPFIQAGRSTEEQQQGVGLGLAISRELARGMGGDLTVKSTVGEGSTFTLKLPRASNA